MAYRFAHIQVRSICGSSLLRDLRSNEVGVSGVVLDQAEWNLLRHDLNIRYPPTDYCPLLQFGRWQDQPHQHLPAARLAPCRHRPGRGLNPPHPRHPQLDALWGRRTARAGGARPAPDAGPV